MSYRDSQFYMTHPFPADFLLCHLYTASVTDDTAVPDSFIFSAMTLIVFCRTEYLFAEKAVALRLVGKLIQCYFQSETSELVEQYVEGLRNTRCRHQVSLDDCLVCLGPSCHVIGFDSKNLLKNI